MYVVTAAFILSGSVSDFDASAQDSIKTVVADDAGVADLFDALRPHIEFKQPEDLPEWDGEEGEDLPLGQGGRAHAR